MTMKIKTLDCIGLHGENLYLWYEHAWVTSQWVPSPFERSPEPPPAVFHPLFHVEGTFGRRMTSNEWRW